MSGHAPSIQALMGTTVSSLRGRGMKRTVNSCRKAEGPLAAPNRWFFLVVLCLVWPTASQAGGWAEAEAGKGALPVMDLTGLSDESRQETARLLGRLIGRPVVLEPPASLLADSLRWAMPDPARSTCPETCTYLTDYIAGMDLVRPPKTHGDVFPALLQLAEKLLLMDKATAALDTLEQALGIVPCVYSVIPPTQVRRVFMLEARAWLLVDATRAREPMASLIAVYPAYRPAETDPGTWRALFEEVAATKLESPRPGLDTSRLEDEGFLDGEPVQHLNQVFPGTHIYQVVSPFGEVRSTVVSLSSMPHDRGAQETVDVTALSDFGLPTRHQVLEMLRHNLLAGRINSLQVIGIERYLSRTGADVVTFLVEPPRDAYPGLRAYRLDAGVSDMPPDLEPLPAPQPRRLEIDMGTGILGLPWMDDTIRSTRVMSEFHARLGLLPAHGHWTLWFRAALAPTTSALPAPSIPTDCPTASATVEPCATLGRVDVAGVGAGRRVVLPQSIEVTPFVFWGAARLTFSDEGVGATGSIVDPVRRWGTDLGAGTRAWFPVYARTRWETGIVLGAQLSLLAWKDDGFGLHLAAAAGTVGAAARF